MSARRQGLGSRRCVRHGVEYERRVSIAQPLDRVFAFISDDERQPRWRDGLRASQRLTPAGPLDGARYAETLETPLGVRTVTVELRANPPHELAFRVVDGPVRPSGSMALSERDGATELTYRVAYEPALRTPLDPAIFSSLRASVDRSLDRLVALAGEM